MRRERVSAGTLLRVYEAVKSVYNGRLKMPALDLERIMQGRKSVTWRVAVAGISDQLEAENFG